MRFSTPRFVRQAACAGLLSSLLTGCAGAKTAFSFQPVLSPTEAPAAPEPALAATAAEPVAEAAPTRAASVPTAARRTHAAIRPSSAAAAVAAPTRRAPLVRALRLTSRHQTRRPAADGRRPHDTWHIILGSALIVGSVLVGLWLGGWLGLGVGAAIMLIGDYFLVLGIGGKHAWQEIFQEFFNM